MAAVDTLLARVRGDDASTADGDLRAALGRFSVVKRSWRGRYRRLLSVTPTCLVTQQPDTLAVTNVWRFSGDDPDVEGVAVGPPAPPGAGGELELTLTVRSDAKVWMQRGGARDMDRGECASKGGGTVDGAR